jgi:hypothetical protein
VDDRAGEGARDAVDALDALDDEHAELVDRARLGPDDDVVGPVTSSACATPSSAEMEAATAAAFPTSVWMRM